MLRRAVVLFAVLLAFWPAMPGARAQDGPRRLHYVAYSAGLRVLDMSVAFDLGPAGYALDLDFRTVGLFSALVSGDSHAVAHGAWAGTAAVPAAYDSHGHWRGEARQTTIDYVDGQPVVRALVPVNQREREPVAPGLQANTIDSLSAMALLVRLVSQTGRCDGGARVFDGRRLSQIAVSTAGVETLPQTVRSSFQGGALRCDFAGTLMAGFRYEDNRARAARPQRGSAWLASVTPGGPILPVRMQFGTPFFGDVTMYVQE